MVHRIETTGTVGSDGSLTLDEVLPVAPGRHRVVVLIEEEPEDVASLDWQSFIRATYGSLASIPIMREPEGDYETRELETQNQYRSHADPTLEPDCADMPMESASQSILKPR